MPRDLIERTFGNVLPFNDWSAIDYVEASPRRTRLTMPCAPHLAAPDGGIAEGPLLALADTTGGLAAMAVFDGARQVATATLQMSALAPMPPGTDVLASAVVVSHDAHSVLVDVDLLAGGEDGIRVRQARVRLVTTHPPAPTSTDADGAAARFVAPTPPDLAFPLSIGFEPAPAGQWRIPFAPHLVGNAARRMVHGGVVAAGMAEALCRMPELDGAPAVILDSTTDYVRPAQAQDMTITTSLRRAGRRYAFADAEVLQEVPGKGLVPVAYMRATVAREQAAQAAAQ